MRTTSKIALQTNELVLFLKFFVETVSGIQLHEYIFFFLL